MGRVYGAGARGRGIAGSLAERRAACDNCGGCGGGAGRCIMGGMIKFTNNYKDCSTENGFQFEFYCDGCGTGTMSAFKHNKLGMAGGALRAASSFFGGLGGTAEAADQAKELMRGKD